MNNVRMWFYSEANKHTQEYNDYNKNYTKNTEKYLILKRNITRQYRQKLKAIRQPRPLNSKGSNFHVIFYRIIFDLDKIENILDPLGFSWSGGHALPPDSTWK